MAARPRRIAIAAALIALAVTIGIIAAVMVNSRQPSLREIFPYGEIRIGVDASNPPFAVATSDDLFGLEIDVGRAIGEQIGLPVRFVNMTFDGLYDSLKADQVDMVIATLTIEQQRLGDVLYTRHYFNAGLVLVSPMNNRLGTMESLPGHSLAYEYGSDADVLARRWLRRIAPFKTQPYELPDHALDAVRFGQADAALVDATSARLHLREHGWQANLSYITDNWYPVAVPIEQVARWQLVDKAVRALADDGTLNEILNNWL